MAIKFGHRSPNKETIALIRSSSFFDEGWYLKEYSYLNLSRTNPAEHYLRKGADAGLNPGPDFDSTWYLSQYRDVAKSGINPLLHYLLHGKNEGRKPVPPKQVPPKPPQFQISHVVNRVVFVLPNGLESNNGYHASAFAKLMWKKGVESIFVVPDPTFASDQANTLNYSNALTYGVQFYGGKDPEIIHAWTPREHVRQISLELLEIYPAAKIVVHIEDNEEYLTEVASGFPWEKLNSMSETDLCGLIPQDCYHPIHGPRFLANADGLTYVIESLSRFNTANKPSTILHPLVDETLFYPRPINYELRHQLGIPDGHMVLVYAGNVHNANWKDVKLLYDAVNALNNSKVGTTLIRTGVDNPEIDTENWPRTFVKEMGWVERIQLPEIYAAANLFVQPGKPGHFDDERAPSKLTDYFASGRPVLLPSANIGLEVIDQVEALVLDFSDEIELTETVQMLSLDHQLSKRLSIGASTFATRHFESKYLSIAMSNFYSGLFKDPLDGRIQ